MVIDAMMVGQSDAGRNGSLFVCYFVCSWVSRQYSRVCILYPRYLPNPEPRPNGNEITVCQQTTRCSWHDCVTCDDTTAVDYLVDVYIGQEDGRDVM
jgi:hypothetical protein